MKKKYRIVLTAAAFIVAISGAAISRANNISPMVPALYEQSTSCVMKTGCTSVNNLYSCQDLYNDPSCTTHYTGLLKRNNP